MIVSHLCFADDILIFSNGGSRSVANLNKAIQSFETTSGQLINKEKSGFIMGANITARRRNVIIQQIGIGQSTLPITYPGIPLFKRRPPLHYFDSLKNKICKRISGWRSKLLSAGGCLTLLKSTLNSITMHLFAVVKPPFRIIKEMQSLITQFIWGDTDKHRWIGVNKTCKPVDKG